MIFILSIIGTVFIYIIGYLTLNSFLQKDNLNLYEKILLSSPLFFIMPLSTYIINLFFNGALLSNKIYFYIFFTSYLIIILFFSYSKNKSDLLYLKVEFKKTIKNINLKKITFISSLFIFISINVYFSVRPLLIAPMLSYGQDFFRHIMYAQQLLNGFLRTHWCYDIAPNQQPFLMHSTIAVLTRIFNFHIFDTIFVLIFFQAILLPVGIALLGYKITNKFWASLLLIFIVCLNGGREFIWRESWVFSIAQQQVLPGLIMRQISITLLPFFIYTIIRIFEERDNVFFKIYSSIILSILGTIHAYVFYFAIVFIVIMIILNFKDKALVKIFLFNLIIGISISFIYYLPLIYDLLTKDLLMWERTDERWTILLSLNRYLTFFGVVGVISPFFVFLLPKIKNKKIFISIFMALIIIYSFTLIVDIITGEEDPILPFRQHRYSFVLYIFLSIMVVFFIILLNKMYSKYIIIMCLFLIFANIAFTTEAILKNSDVWCELSTREGIKFSSLLRDGENAADKLLEVANKKDIIAVPPQISKIFVHYSGLDVVFAPWWYELFEENIPKLQFDRKEDIETIYNLNTDEIVIKKILEKYRVKYFLIFKENKNRFDSINYLKLIDEGKWLDNKYLLIYEVLI